MILIIVLGILLISLLHFNSIDADQKKFRHPHELDLNFDEIVLTKGNDVRSNDQAVTFYLRLVKHLFRKQRFRSDPHNENSYIANIPLRVNKNQYDMMVDSDVNGLNLEELDGLVEDVLKQSKDEEHSIPQILLDYYRQEIIGSVPNFNSPLFLSIVAVAIILLFTRLFHLSKLTFSAIIVIVILIICGISYSMTYHDCMNDLEAEQMIQISKENTIDNPCKNYHGERESTWSSLKTHIFGSSKSECLEHMRKTFKPSKKYCDPLEVFARWSAKIQMSYIGSITGEFLELLSKFTSSSNILTKIVMTIAAVVFFGFLIISNTNVAVKCGFQGIFKMFSSSPSAPRNETLEALNQKMDAILSKNMEMERELSIIRECSVERSLKNSPTRTRTKRHKLSSIQEANKREDDSSPTSDS